MNLDDFKANVTYEKKTTYGIIGIVLGALFWGMGRPYIGFMDIFLLILPCIFLALPSQTTKNSKGLAIVSGIILLIALFVVLFGYFYNPLSPILQFILCIYGFFCAYVMTIPTGPKQLPINSSNMNSNNSQKFDKYCSKCGQGLFKDSRFCSKCGAKITNDVIEDSFQDIADENNAMVCSECGEELDEDSNFCPECGVEVIDVADDSFQDIADENNAMVCSECGQELREDSKFCPECGADVISEVVDDSSSDVEEETDELVCSECGQELREDSKFCPECGTIISSEENASEK